MVILDDAERLAFFPDSIVAHALDDGEEGAMQGGCLATLGDVAPGLKSLAEGRRETVGGCYSPGAGRDQLLGVEVLDVFAF